MRSMSTNALHDGQGSFDAHSPVVQSQHHHPNDLHSLHPDMHTSHISNLDSVSVSAMANMYFPSFQDTGLSLHMSQYPYSMSEGPMDLQYILGANITLPHNLLVEESAPPSTNDIHQLQCTAVTRPHEYSPQTPPVESPEEHSPLQTHSPSPESRSRNGSFSILSPTVQTNGHAHTMLPPMIHPNPDDPVPFDAESRSFNQRINPTGPTKADPFAGPFLQNRLGEDKWNVFSARLFERRLSGTKSKSRSKARQSESESDKGGATAIDFLIKVEVVKEILRTYVPHPYNPLKSLAHPYEHSPTGQVTLTRSTILALSGWSNTQFSYWARRAEAISVLASHDDRLHSVAVALERRLRGDGDTPLQPDGSPSLGTPFREDHSANVTGKGLDIIIDEVKKRTGVSQFLRGKHSSLDPFGSASGDGEGGGDGGNGTPVPAPVYMPTFQALEYTHSPPPVVPPPERRQKRGRGRQGSNAESMHSQQSSGTGLDDAASVAEDDSMTHLSFSVSDSRAFDSDLEKGGAPASSPEVQLISLPPSPMRTTFVTTVGPLARPRRAVAAKVIQQNNGTDNNHPGARRELYPVSDSRFELDNLPQKRTGDTGFESPAKKRTRQFEAVL